MNALEQRICDYAEQNPHKLAIQGDNINLDYASLWHEIQQLSSRLELLSNASPYTFAVLLDNDPAWAVLDLALFFNQQCSVPLPKFFSMEQLKHALTDSQAQYLILDRSNFNTQLIEELSDDIIEQTDIVVAEKELLCLHLKRANANDGFAQTSSENPVKITYTSGTTDKPKGVLLSEQAILSKVAALAIASEANENDIALSILPLSTLLENIGGLYVTLYCGASVILLAPASIGLTGSSQIDAQQLLKSIQQYQPTAFIIIPQLLLLLVNAISNGFKLPSAMRFIAMGGAPISEKVLAMAGQLQIPVFEGYGLSEAVSVVAVNNPSHHKSGSVGRVLEANQVKISDTGEVLVKGDLFNGYLGQAARNDDNYYATGDLGYFDEDNYLFINGRKKNIINTSFGRNISPEWVEKELEAIPQIAQCLVYGHAKPNLVAILVLREISNDLSQLEAEIKQLNAHLPDYARIGQFIIADSPFTVANEQLTGTGRPRRELIYNIYQQQLEQCYHTE
ncbi:AMP-binding protein [sulfur-oxidizing endosymbiont of Gigantopelta aegis]|uniref:AMP-binding protein n=1 Tax=sulfur-oxidizing endosymbiont of Gigantopelta aegis TaxID=2794934 RepID=UPI0018DB60F3|nr:AMP-binding protein [sulfur-oxidizing endosymbiont of Gigantopelta aegis]